MPMEEEKRPASENPEPNEETPRYSFSTRELLYSFDKDSGFARAVTYHHEHTRQLIQQDWDVMEECLAEVREEVLSGKASPIKYHMERCRMDPAMLGAYMGMAAWRIRRHFKPRVYKKLKDSVKNEYARVFMIRPEQLDDVNMSPLKEKGTV